MAERKITDSQQTESLDSIFVNDGGNLRQIPKEKAREALGITDAESNIDDLKSDLSHVITKTQLEKSNTYERIAFIGNENQKKICISSSESRYTSAW